MKTLPPISSINTKNPARHRQMAFTLIELLVVIAIIAILAVLLFVGAKSAMDKSKVAKSTSNLRQIAILAATWTGENNGMVVPGKAMSKAGNDNQQWQVLLSEVGPKPMQGIWNLLKDNKWVTDENQIFINPHTPKADDFWNTGWGINMKIAGTTAKPNTAESWGSVPSQLVFPDATRRVLILDWPEWNAYYDQPKAQALLKKRNNKILALYLDGHIATLRGVQEVNAAMNPPDL